jgi:phage-related protein
MRQKEKKKMEQKGSFIGFTFDGIHSSQLGIFRTSNSDRYQIDLTPKMADITTDLQTATGLYYWGTSYGGREFSISYAFFGMTEKQLGQIKEIFGGKKIAPLIFDEEPYKVWSAKVTGSVTAKHVCFSSKGARFYAGTGELQFTTYHPYAQSREEYLERYTEDYIPEWREANSILSNKDNTIRI